MMTYEKTLNRIPALLWIEALESGKYKQGTGIMRTIEYEERWCCLGVLQEIAVEQGVISSSDFIGGQKFAIPLAVMGWVGIPLICREEYGDYDLPLSCALLASINDGDVAIPGEDEKGGDFQQIAAFLRTLIRED